MRLDKPRIAPLDLDEIPDEIRERFVGAPMDNIFRTLSHHPKLFKRWLVFGTHILRKSTLSPRDRELAILRVGWLCQAEYEWGQHVLVGQKAGLSSDEITRITRGPDNTDWSERDRTILRAVDELHGDAFITNETWSRLATDFNDQQIMDLVFTVGQYNLVSMALNSLGVQLDDHLPRFPTT